MTTQQPVKRRGQTRSLKDKMLDIEKSVVSNRDTLDFSLAAAVQPIMELPATLDVLRLENRLCDLPKVDTLCKAISADVDVFVAQAAPLKAELKSILETPVQGGKNMAKRYDKLFFLGANLIELNDRVTETCGASVGQLHEILQPSPVEAAPATTEPCEAVS